jgi:hypothetical protein
MTDRLRSALFLDFDNIFTGLMSLHREAALGFASQPGEWLTRLTGTRLPHGVRRDILVRRAYLNPNGWVMDAELGNENGRLYLQRFRPHLTRAGFEVVDCPALTAQRKNAADIRIVIDVLSCIGAGVRYDELLVASSDADFTPLRQRLRAEDRRTVIIAAGTTALAYQSVADEYVDEEALIELALGADDATQKDEGRDGAGVVGSDVEAARDQSETVVRSLLTDAGEPVHLSKLGVTIRRAVGGEIVDRTRWFGAGGLRAFVRSFDNHMIAVNDMYAWLPGVHEAPWERTNADIALPPSVIQLCRVTDMPRLAKESWPEIFRALAEYAATDEFNLTRCTAWTRDILAERGTPVGRQVIGFIVRGAGNARVRLSDRPPPCAQAICEGFLANVIERAVSAGLKLEASEETELRGWVSARGAVNAT